MIVVWRITERCTLSCPFCANDASLAGLRREADPAQVERFGRLLAQFRQRSGGRMLLSWLGGEPLLWPPLLAVSQRLCELGLELSLTTNGILLEKAEIRQALLAYFSEITVSIDGPATFHDPLRGSPGGWQQMADAVKSLAASRSVERRPKLRANIVLMRDNLPMFAELCETLAMWGIDEITFNPLGGRERPDFFSDHRLRPEDAEYLAFLLPPLRAKLATQGTRLCGGSAYMQRIAASVKGQSLPIADCAPGRHFLFVEIDGQVAPCSLTSGAFGIHVDALASVDDLLALPERFAAHLKNAPQSACQDCASTQVFAKFLN